MTARPPRFWASIVDAETPSAAEMAAEEAELRALSDSMAGGQVRAGIPTWEPTDEGLPAEQVERLVARATDGTGESRHGPLEGVGAAAHQSSTRRTLLMAALLMLSLASLSWVGMRTIWPEQRDSVLHLDFAHATLLATEPNRDDQAHMAAIAILSDHCGLAIDTLQQLRAGDELRLAAEADRIVRVLAALLASTPTQPPGLVNEHEMIGVAAAALDHGLSFDYRQQALAQLEELTTAGLTAILVAPLDQVDPRLNRQILIDQLLADLRD